MKHILGNCFAATVSNLRNSRYGFAHQVGPKSVAIDVSNNRNFLFHKLVVHEVDMLDGIECSVKGHELGQFGRMHMSDFPGAVLMNEVDLVISIIEEDAKSNLCMLGVQALE